MNIRHPVRAESGFSLVEAPIGMAIIGFVFVLDTVSVILQVTYFEVTHGRRLFRMTPIHHGFEISGWPETLVVGRFWIMGILAGAIGVALSI